MSHYPKLDVIVITAANRAQAAFFRAQMLEREDRGLLPPECTWRVIPDPGDRSLGSGMSTISVLADLATTLFSGGETVDACFRGKRALVIHSGGDARRIPAYAALGKAFLPMPCDVIPPGRSPWQRLPAAILDLLLETFVRIPRPSQGEVLVCSGDVLLTFDAAQTNLYAEDGIAGLGIACPPLVGERHGVYVTPNPASGGLVSDFLQKPTLAQMQTHGAIDSDGHVLVDTGVLSFSPHAIEALLHAAGVRIRGQDIRVIPGLYADTLAGRISVVDLYREIILTLPSDISSNTYLASLRSVVRTPHALETLSDFYRAMREANVPLFVAASYSGEFFHVGSSGDLLTRFAQRSRASHRFGFKSGHRTSDCGPTNSSRRAIRTHHPIVYNSVVNLEHAEISGHAFIEACDLGDETHAPLLHLDGDNILVGVRWRDFPENIQSLHLPTGIGMVCLPVFDPDSNISRIVPMLFGTLDDNKAAVETGQWRLFNQRLEMLVEAGIPRDALWPGESEHSGWTARLWSIAERRWDTLRLMLDLLGRECPLPDAARAVVAIWEQESSAARFSLRDLMQMIDYDELLKRRQVIAAEDDNRHLLADILDNNDFPASEVISRLEKMKDENEAAGRLLTNLHHRLSIREDNSLPVLQRARLLHTASVILRSTSLSDGTDSAERSTGAFSRHQTGWTADGLDQSAFDEIASAVASASSVPHGPQPAAILHDQVVWVTAPARIDFAGGWSDTPPICLEMGGAVLNAAVSLNRQYPVQVMAKLNDENCIRLTSIDLGRQEVFCDAAALGGPVDLAHWTSLARAALALTGIAPDIAAGSTGLLSGGRDMLQQSLEVLGGGLDLTLFSGLPKGSGMGTSSILGAAVLACLMRVLGKGHSQTELIGLTSLLEQRMTSGGGWQDQVGGILAGAKLICTEPGMQQVPSVQWTSFGAAGKVGDPLRERMLLYFTGQKRLAKNILQNIVGSYLAREPHILRLVKQLKQGAIDAKYALEANDADAFASCVNDYWEMKKAIDPGSTNQHIEEIIGKIRAHTSACSLCGAGGGGFMLIIARDEAAKRKIQSTLQTAPPNLSARFFDFEIDQVGLAVTVL